MEEQPKSYIDEHGSKIWYLPSKGKDYWHRLDGPAIEDEDGSKWWYVDGKQHRLDGPAVEDVDGIKHWYVDGKHLPTEEVETWLEENNIDLSTEAGQMAFKLRWA